MEVTGLKFPFPFNKFCFKRSFLAQSLAKAGQGNSGYRSVIEKNAAGNSPFFIRYHNSYGIYFRSVLPDDDVLNLNGYLNNLSEFAFVAFTVMKFFKVHANGRFSNSETIKVSGNKNQSNLYFGKHGHTNPGFLKGSSTRCCIYDWHFRRPKSANCTLKHLGLQTTYSLDESDPNGNTTNNLSPTLDRKDACVALSVFPKAMIKSPLTNSTPPTFGPSPLGSNPR